MNIMGQHPRHIVIGIVAAMLALALAAGVTFAVRAFPTDEPSSGGRSDDDAFPSVTFGDTVIEEREYLQTLKTQRAAASNHFKRQYGVSLGSSGWTQEHDGEIPYRWLAERTIAVLREHHAAYLIGVKAGLVDDDSYAGVVSRMEALNRHNRQAKANGEIVYGRTSYDIASYLDYELSALENTYTSDESNPGMALSDADVQEYYDAHDWTIDGVDGKAPLDEVRGNVKTQMRAERYDALVSDEAAAIDADVPWDKLYTFTLSQVS